MSGIFSYGGERRKLFGDLSRVVFRWERWDTSFSVLCCSPLNGRAVLGASEYGNATEGYWLTNVQCNGSESNITSCPSSQWAGDENCDVTEPAGVSCLPDNPTPPPRIASSMTYTYAKIEIFDICRLLNK